jgi:hypothetical protein
LGDTGEVGGVAGSITLSRFEALLDEKGKSVA